MALRKHIPGVRLPHKKNTAGLASRRIPPPEQLILPMNMHAGSPAVPVVSPGERVLVGQLVARESERNSAPVHAGVSGKVRAIEPYGDTLAIRIDSDGLMEKLPGLAPPVPEGLEEFLQAVRESGIVGLGGAAFPLWAKLAAARHNHIKTVLVNGAECEPYITSDDRTMVEQSAYVKKGIELLKKYLGSQEFIIGVEGNKPRAIEELNRVFADEPGVRIKRLDSVYPQGAKQVLLYNALGKVVEEGQRMAALGVIIINVSTLAALARYMTEGMPLVERCVTFDGSGVIEPANIIVPVGTPLRHLVEQAGGLRPEAARIILGGPMMGRRAESLDEPVVKGTNAVLALDRREAACIEPSTCIHCGRCVESCPISLNPTQYSKAMEMQDEAERYELLQREKIQLCIECGCCSYVCPTHRPLAETNRHAKGFVRKYKAGKERGGK